MEDEMNAEFNNEKKVLCEKIIRDINAVFHKDADLSVKSNLIYIHIYFMLSRALLQILV